MFPNKNVIARLMLICSWSLTTVVTTPLFASDQSPNPKIAPRLVNDTARGGSADAFIVLGEQANLSAAAALPTKQSKGTYVYQSLRAVADRTQAPIRKLLEERGISYQSFYIVNMLKVNANRELLQELAGRPDVSRVEANPQVRTSLPAPTGVDTGLKVPGIEWNISRVGAPGVWALGYNGAGVVVASADTGVKWDHPALKSHYRGWNGTTANHNYNWLDTTIDNFTVPQDPNSHGTFTTSEMVGDDGVGNQVGMAPGAKWIGCRNMDRNGNGNPAQYIACFEFFLAPYPIGHPEQANPALAPDIINNSWDCPVTEGCSIYTLEAIVDAVRAAGIFPVMAAGNSGPGCSTVSVPPTFYGGAMSVGGIDYYNNSITMSSSRGPVKADNSGRMKPEITAPGDYIRAAVTYNNGYQGYWSGTSMAAPHVAGGIALLWQAKPSLDGNINATELLLEQTATHMTTTQNCGGSGQNVPNNVYGYGLLNVLKAVQSALRTH